MIMYDNHDSIFHQPKKKGRDGQGMGKTGEEADPWSDRQGDWEAVQGDLPTEGLHDSQGEDHEKTQIWHHQAAGLKMG